MAYTIVMPPSPLDIILEICVISAKTLRDYVVKNIN